MAGKTYRKYTPSRHVQHTTNIDEKANVLARLRSEAQVTVGATRYHVLRGMLDWRLLARAFRETAMLLGFFLIIRLAFGWY